MKGIILASHGRLAEGMKDTLQIFCGEVPDMRALCLMPGEEMSDFLEGLQTAIDEVDSGDGVVIFCDLLFGSPCNCSARLLGEERYQGRVDVITGMNLSMILEYAGSRESGMERSSMVQTGQAGIVDFNELMASRKGS